MLKLTLKLCYESEKCKSDPESSGDKIYEISLYQYSQYLVEEKRPCTWVINRQTHAQQLIVMKKFLIDKHQN